MTAVRLVVSVLVVPLAFLGADFEAPPAVRSRSRDRREEERREEVSRRGRQWFIPRLVSSAFAAGDEFEPKRETTGFAVEVKIFDRVEELIAACKALGAWAGTPNPRSRFVGCNAYYPDSKRCVLYVPRPKYGDDQAMGAAGHEFWHCVAGSWHGRD